LLWTIYSFLLELVLWYFNSSLRSGCNTACCCICFNLCDFSVFFIFCLLSANLLSTLPISLNFLQNMWTSHESRWMKCFSWWLPKFVCIIVRFPLKNHKQRLSISLFSGRPFLFNVARSANYQYSSKLLRPLVKAAIFAFLSSTICPVLINFLSWS